MKILKGLQGKELAVAIAANSSRRIKPQRIWELVPQDLKEGGAGRWREGEGSHLH